MKDREALKIEATPLDPLTAADGFGGFLSTIFVVAAAGAVVFGLLASGSGEPLLLTVIAVLAMLGLFLLFGIAAGHVRIGARMPPGDVLKAAADVARRTADGRSRRRQRVVLEPRVRRDVRHAQRPVHVGALEAAVSGDPDASQALFR